MGYTSDSMPFIGKIPHRSNQYMLAGFNGHGMPQIFLTAKGIANMVLDEKLGFEGSGIPRIYEVTKERMESGVNHVLEGWKKAQKTKEAQRVPMARL